ncbi:hypothetical protein MATL_G00013830 [Megalops atlanticus]|uniref:Uncharacterized protein n=1 Tax=Megalops atlanticus TaxID=7932 RepID=A0A9D3QKA3_MEGAT|nr:hypothetical protein MATL_G00013830 [Megalops atlanticus]
MPVKKWQTVCGKRWKIPRDNSKQAPYVVLYTIHNFVSTFKKTTLIERGIKCTVILEDTKHRLAVKGDSSPLARSLPKVRGFGSSA